MFLGKRPKLAIPPTPTCRTQKVIFAHPKNSQKQAFLGQNWGHSVLWPPQSYLRPYPKDQYFTPSLKGTSIPRVWLKSNWTCIMYMCVSCVWKPFLYWKKLTTPKCCRRSLNQLTAQLSCTCFVVLATVRSSFVRRACKRAFGAKD